MGEHPGGCGDRLTIVRQQGQLFHRPLAAEYYLVGWSQHAGQVASLAIAPVLTGEQYDRTIGGANRPRDGRQFGDWPGECLGLCPGGSEGRRGAAQPG